MRRGTLIITFIYLGIFLIFQLTGYNETKGILLFALIMSLNILLIVRSYKKQNSILLIISLFITIYTYVLKYAFIDGKQISYYYYFNDITHIYKTALLFFLFLIFLNASIKIPKNTSRNIIKTYNNPIFFYVFYSIAFLAMIFGKTGENIFSGGEYGSSSTSMSSLNEYFFIPFVLSIVFSNNNKTKNLLIYVLGSIYALKNLLFGGRIEVMMILLCIYIWKFHFRFTSKKIIIVALVAFYFFGIFGNIRQNPTILLSDRWYEVFIPGKGNTVSNIVVSQEGDVFYATNRLVSMADEQILNTTDRISAFFYFIISIVVPYSMLPDIASLSNYNISEYDVGGGGLIFGYFYVFLSYIGIVAISIYIGKVLSKIGVNESSFKFKDIYTIFIFITLPRWYAYSPITMFKLCLYGAIISVSVIYLDKLLRKSHAKNE